MPETQHLEPTHSLVRKQELTVKNVDSLEQMDRVRSVFRILIKERAKARNVELNEDETRIVEQWIDALKVFTDQTAISDYFGREPDPFAERLLIRSMAAGYFTATSFAKREFNIPYIYVNPSLASFAETMVHELSHAADWAVDSVQKIRRSNALAAKDYKSYNDIFEDLSTRDQEKSTTTLKEMFARTAMITASQFLGSLGLTIVEATTKPESHYPLFVMALLGVTSFLSLMNQPGYTNSADEVRARATEKRVKKKPPFYSKIAKLFWGHSSASTPLLVEQP